MRVQHVLAQPGPTGAPGEVRTSLQPTRALQLQVTLLLENVQASRPGAPLPQTVLAAVPARHGRSLQLPRLRLRASAGPGQVGAVPVHGWR